MVSKPLLLVAALGVLLGIYFRNFQRCKTPLHMSNHHVVYRDNLISDETFDELNELIKHMKAYPSNIGADLLTGGFKMRHEHIGEIQPINPDHTCGHPYLVPNLDKTGCILAQRVDIGKHFVLTGGPDGIREPYEKMINRLTSFGRYIFNISDYAVTDRLFSDKAFLAEAASVCPPGKPVLDPFQFNIIIQVPGQSVALHIDAPYFWGASRREFPQWLLACMVFSGLFKEEFIDQVQVVGYLHKWEVNNRTDLGNFVYYPTSNIDDMQIVHPNSKAGSIVDGSKTVHAAVAYKLKENAPFLDKSKYSELNYVGNDKWEVRMEDEVLREYDHDDLRISIVYRARCFESEARRQEYRDYPEDKKMTLDYILGRLKADLVSRGVITAQQLEAMSRLDLSLYLMDQYVTYPFPAREKAFVPFNYCALPRLLPWTAPVVGLIC